MKFNIDSRKYIFKNPTAGLCPGNVELRLNRWNTNAMGEKINKLLSHRVQVSLILLVSINIVYIYKHYTAYNGYFKNTFYICISIKITRDYHGLTEHPLPNIKRSIWIMMIIFEEYTPQICSEGLDQTPWLYSSLGLKICCCLTSELD